MAKEYTDSLGCWGIILGIVFFCGLPYSLSLIIIVPIIMGMISLWNKIFGKSKEKEDKTFSQKDIEKPTLSSLHKPVVKTPTITPIIQLEHPVIHSDVRWNPEYIESNTSYANVIENCGNLTFAWVKSYASQRQPNNPLLHRGVEPLQNEDELYQYIHQFGNMHYAKLVEAFSNLPLAIRVQKLHIIDWGCGQGLATITYLIKKRPSLCKITLIEPGLPALKRAALNVKYFHRKYSMGIFNCRTLNKDFDLLTKEDLSVESDSCKIHLFSNTLDIENRYDIKKLITLIKSTQKGKNYFICVSPYQNEEKRRRIISFVEKFKDCDNFVLHYEAENKREDDLWECNTHYRGYNPEKYCDGACSSCNSKWTRIIRVFSVNL